MSTWCHYYKKSHAYINSLYLTSLFVILSVFAYLLSWNRWNLSILILGAFPLADRNASHLFSGPALKATSFIEKCLFHFHTDLPRGGSDICRKQSQTMYSLLPLSLLPVMMPSGHPTSSPAPKTAQTHVMMNPFDHWLWIRFRSDPLLWISAHSSLKCLKSKANQQKLVKLIWSTKRCKCGPYN